MKKEFHPTAKSHEPEPVYRHTVATISFPNGNGKVCALHLEFPFSAQFSSCWWTLQMESRVMQHFLMEPLKQRNITSSLSVCLTAAETHLVPFTGHLIV